MPQLEFFVPGIPAPQGSKTPGRAKGGRLYVREANPRTEPWRKLVQEHAEAALLASDEWDSDYDGPVWVGLEFRFPKLVSDPNRYWKTTAPDKDKLERAILDALTKARVYTDDARVCAGGPVIKIHHATPGVQISLCTLEHPIPFEGAIAA
jgi:crossover junction endodeoxyribonuclease RusA